MLFDDNFKQAARAAVGKKIKIGKIEAEIMKAQGFSRKQNEEPLYAPILEMRPGRVYCPRYRGAVLLLVACRDGVGPGGCVLIRDIKIGDTVHKGPGKVTEALGIEEHGETGSLTESKGVLTLTV